MIWDCVVGQHQEALLSGVGRFNDRLARAAGVPLLTLHDELLGRAPMLSFKVSELGIEERRVVESLARSGITYAAFLHELTADPLEALVSAAADEVFAANGEILRAVTTAGQPARLAFAPSLIADARSLSDVVTVFTFGMAHKLRVDRYRRLRDLLEAGPAPYAMLVSVALRTTRAVDEARIVEDDFHTLFGDRAFFLGTLSDVMVVHHLVRSTFFAAFFEKGVRDNNTSVMTALEHGAVVITNRDADSPKRLVHGHNVLDVDRLTALPREPPVLEALGNAARAATTGWSWDELVAILRGR